LSHLKHLSPNAHARNLRSAIQVDAVEFLFYWLLSRQLSTVVNSLNVLFSDKRVVAYNKSFITVRTIHGFACALFQIRSDLFVIKGHWPLTHHEHSINSNYTKYIECIGYRHKLTCNIS